VGFSERITGPFVDQLGNPMLGGNATYLLGGANSAGNPAPGRRGFGWAAGGGQSLLRSSPGNAIPGEAPGKQTMVLHAYDATTGDPWLQLVEVDWAGGWPVVDEDARRSLRL